MCRARTISLSSIYIPIEFKRRNNKTQTEHTKANERSE